MLRPGSLFGLFGSAAIATVLVLPTVRASADRWAPETPAVASPVVMQSFSRGGARPVVQDFGTNRVTPVHYATMPRPEPRVAPAPAKVGTSASEKELPKPRRMTREGCEAPLSSLVGPEARRMVPGRCMT